jgi:uroporphyrinogen decarboxylase
LASHKAVIGFSGAPFTLTSYLLDEKPSQGVPVSIRWLSEQPEAWQNLMDVLVEAITAYLRMQADAGADAVQIFDSWAGACPAEFWQQAVYGPLERIVANLKQSHPHLPIILFPRGANQIQLQAMAQNIPAALSLGTEVDIAWASENLQPHTAIQGNLDPLLFTEEDTTNLRKAIQAIKLTAGRKPGFVWNLGHGLTPQTRIEAVQATVDAIRS